MARLFGRQIVLEASCLALLSGSNTRSCALLVRGPRVARKLLARLFRFVARGVVGFSTIVAADFDAGGRNVLDSATVKGKKKKGALQLHTSTVLCSVTTKGGKKFEVGGEAFPVAFSCLYTLVGSCWKLSKLSKGVDSGGKGSRDDDPRR